MMPSLHGFAQQNRALRTNSGVRTNSRPCTLLLIEGREDVGGGGGERMTKPLVPVAATPAPSCRR